MTRRNIMKIGNLDLENKILLAPMAEVTDAPMRKISRKYGAGLTFTQMVSAKGIITNQFYTLQNLAYEKSEKPIGVQIVGRDPFLIASAVSELKSFSPDLIDLNSGCSVSRVARELKMGANLMDEPELLSSILKGMVRASGGIPVTVKLRLGKDRNNINVIRNAIVAEEAGVSAVIVHTRTRADRYSDDSKWGYLKEVKKAVGIPVIGNGSLFSPDDIVRMIDSTGCDSVMIARGALGNPFIFSRYNEILKTGRDPGQPGVQEVLSAALEHLDMIIKEFGSIVGYQKCKKHMIWYFKDFPGVYSLIEGLLSVSDPGLATEIIQEHAASIDKGFFAEEGNEVQEKFKDKVLFWLGKEAITEG